MKRILLALSALLFAFPAAAAVPVPAGYIEKKIDCATQGDDFKITQAAFNAAQPKTVLRLLGPCSWSLSPRLSNKTQVMIAGSGREGTVITATNEASGGIVIYRSSYVILADLTLSYAKTTKRWSTPEQDCFAILQSSYVTVDNVFGKGCAAAGVLVYISQNVVVQNSEIADSRADAFHAEIVKSVVIQKNIARRPGDDMFASIGPGARANFDVTIQDNQGFDSWWGGGVAFEGTLQGRAYRNRIVGTGVSCYRVASEKAWAVVLSDSIDMADNYGADCVRRVDTGHGAIQLYSNLGTVGPNVMLQRMTIDKPRSGPCVRVYGKTAMITAKFLSSFCNLIPVKAAIKVENGNTLAHSGNKRDGALID